MRAGEYCASDRGSTGGVYLEYSWSIYSLSRVLGRSFEEYSQSLEKYGFFGVGVGGGW